MARGRERATVQHFRTLFHLGTVAALSDAQLLERFATRNGEVAELAFAALVERHGPMVLRVCRRILANPHDAEDAFQATFLILLRRAGSVRKLDSVASWLHGVAYRVSSNARCAMARRQRHEEVVARRALPEATAATEVRDPEFEAALHQELHRLPEKYREAVVLCDLEGQTYEQASWQLRCPIGTIKSRLVRGRTRLRDRLLRRGLAPAATAIGVNLFANNARASLPPRLLAAVLRLWPARGGAAVVGGSVAMLARQWRWTMMGTQVKFGGVVAACVIGGALLGLGLHSLADEGSKAAASPAEATAVRPAPSITEIRSQIDEPTSVLWLVKEGTWVRKGRALVELDPAPLRQNLADQEIKTQAAEAAYQNAKLTREVSEIAVEEYKEGIYKEDAATMQGEIELAKSDLQRAQDRVEWARRMYDKGYVSKVQKTSEELNYERAKVTLDNAQTKKHVLDKFTKDKTIKELESEVEKARAYELKTKAMWNLEQRREAELNKQISKCTIRSPGDGLVIYPRKRGVSEPVFERGDTVRPGQVILWLVSEPRDDGASQ
jgi:RNA polymerase sigma factor (sigma-70 family)